MKDFTSEELEVLIEVLTSVENQFDSELCALAEVFDHDEEWIDVEVNLDDGTSEQYKIERCLLGQGLTPRAIAETIN